MKKAVLIVNPSSGNEEAKKYAGQAREKLEQFFDEVDVQETEKEGDATKFAAKRLRKKSIVFSRWAEMEQLMKQSVDWLNRSIVRNLVSSH